jgi:UDP-glucose 4-epimerase
MNVLVTGGAGYIGSHAVRKLVGDGHNVVVVDNCGNGHKEAVPEKVPLFQVDISDKTEIRRIVKSHKVEAVMHFAAYIEVAESVKDPSKYYNNNFSKALVLFDTLKEEGVKKIVFSSTAAVYGQPDYTPIDENHPQRPINPYGKSKLMVEGALSDLASAYGLGYVSLRYFNVAGASPDASIGEDHHPETHLIPRILKTAMNSTEAVQIYGTDYGTPDGTCVRDYVHVEDLVAAHLLALNAIQQGQGKVYNLGSEKGFSVREVIEACRAVTGAPLRAEERERRPGDPAILVASSAKIRAELNWRPEYPDLRTIVAHAWRWHKEHPNGYAS